MKLIRQAHAELIRERNRMTLQRVTRTITLAMGGACGPASSQLKWFELAGTRKTGCREKQYSCNQSFRFTTTSNCLQNKRYNHRYRRQRWPRLRYRLSDCPVTQTLGAPRGLYCSRTDTSASPKSMLHQSRYERLDQHQIIELTCPNSPTFDASPPR